MTRECSIVLVAAVLGLVGACNRADLLNEPGDPCRSLRTPCLDDSRSLRCIDEAWAEVDCAEVCGDLAPGVVSEGCEEDACVCSPPEGGCTPGAAVCEDAETLRWCTNSWAWSTDPCAGLCAEIPPQSESHGCFPATEEFDLDHCFCTIEGTECNDEDVSFCVEQAAISECADGFWRTIDCVEACGQEEAICRPGEADGAGCDC